MDIRKEIEGELKELAPNLAMIKKTNPFKVSENYFETLSRNISDTIALKDSKKQSWNLGWLLRWLLKPQYSLSALIILIIFSVNYFFPDGSASLTIKESQLTLDNLNTEDLAVYVEENIGNFSDAITEQYCCVEMNSADYLFQNKQEQENYIDNYLINQIKEEDIL